MHVRAVTTAAMALSLLAACSSDDEPTVASGRETAGTVAGTSVLTGDTVATVTTDLSTSTALTSESVATVPAVTEAAVSEPATTEPPVTKPAVTGPAVTDPAVTGPAASDVSIPQGTMAVESSALAVTFAVPETYTVLDPSALGDDFYRGAAFEELATRAGLTIGEFERLLKEAVELYVFAPAAAEGFVDNVTVTAVPSPQLPTAEQLEQTFVGLGAQNLTIDSGSRRGLDYVQTVYELPVAQEVVYGVDLHVLIGDTPVEITATAATRQTADDLGELVLATVAPT